MNALFGGDGILTTSQIATEGTVTCYGPDLKGFVKEKTKAIYYTTTNNEIDSVGLEVPISDYLSGEVGRTTYMEIYKNNGFLEEKLADIYNINSFALENGWFDYGNKKWANLKTAANGVECWWVWIPSYAYNITGDEIKIIFIDENGQPLDGSTLPANYIPHPAFTGKKGIWVSKYEPSS